MGVQMGTFGSFTTARLAIYASQSSLNVTGNNIANINTKGYTRQRMDLVSLYPSGEARYSNNYNLSIGYGVLCDSVSQLRDPFLDIRYRNENASLGAYEAKLNGLRQLAHKLDEVGKGDQGFGVIEDQLSDFVQKLQSWNNLTSVTEYDDLVRGSADELCKLFNTTAQGLQEVYDNEVKYLEQNVAKANSLLTQIRNLNEQIRAHNIYGDSALELKDARNVAIDELSSLIKIDVTYSMEKIDQFTEVEKLTITLPGTKDPAISKADAQTQALADNLANLKDPAAYEAATDEDKLKILADPNSYKSEGYPKKLEDYNYSSNFGKPIKLIDGIYGSQINIKKIYKENPNYQGRYMIDDNHYTDDVTQAGLVDDGNGNKIPRENPNYGKQFLDEAGNPTDVNTGRLNPAFGKYLDSYGEPTDDIEKADFEYDDKFLMDVAPLVDKRGKFMRDPKYGVQLTETIDLKDNDLFGAIQSMRELLTEEGEFSSDFELGRDLDKILDEAKRFRAELIADPNASTKRGIPYYMKALDNLAKQFAREVNKINQPNQYANKLDANNRPIFAGDLDLSMIYQTYQPKNGEVADYSRMYKTGKSADPTDTNDYFLDADGNIITDNNGAGITPDAVKYANLDPKTLHADFAKLGPADLDLTGAADPANPTEAELNAARLAKQNEAITEANAKLDAVKAGGVPQETFVNEKGEVITTEVTLPDGTKETRPLTFDDVKYAGLDPVVLATKEVPKLDAGGNPVLNTDGTPVMEKVPLFNSMEEQTAAIQAAQKNLEVLRAQGTRTDEWNFYQGGALLSNNGNNNDTTGITAANISVALDWANGAVRVLNTVQPNEVYVGENGEKKIITHSTAGDNITHMISSLLQQRDFDAKHIDSDSASKNFYFRGTFQEMFTKISGTLALDQNETTSQYNQFDLETLNLDNDRQSISGVDLNEEATSMMQYQKSYSAACQLLTIIDSMLDKLINGTI